VEAEASGAELKKGTTMHIELHTPGMKLSRARAQALQQQVQAAFGRLAHRIVRVVLSVSPATAEARPGARRCSVEVHMRDGHVARAEERRRRFGTLLQRAIGSAWRAAARWLLAQQARRPLLRLPARRSARQPALLPAPASEGGHG
jgi:hypothetical protein